jgi:crotonobetaine/carnitine-CoA ligase
VSPPDDSRLLRGTGPDLGPFARRMPPAERTLLHVLRHQAEARPHHEWLVFDGADRLTFAQAQAAVHAFAAALTDSTGPAHVALFLRNQHEFMPAFLGAQAAGGVAVPLNPELQGPLLERMLRKSRARVLVARADLLERLAALDGPAGLELVIACGGAEDDLPATIHGIPVIAFDTWTAAHTGAVAPGVLPAPSDVAALVFTSGTSGGSKAAVWSHHYLYLSSACVSDALEHTPEDVLGTSLQMCHIAGLQNFANSALHVGCTAHLKSRFSAGRFWEEVVEDGTTFAMLMGQMAAMVLAEVPEAPPHRLARVYILPQPQGREEFERRYRTTVIWQGWGMTEIFPHPPARERLEDVGADMIGPAPAWVDFGVVDEHDRMLGSGELGELVYRPLMPDGMAGGYFEDPEATARAFRNFMFHTGDLGYYDEQHRMHFVMRNQDSIRRRGENVSAVELESVALGHPSVLDAAAYAVPAELGEHEVKLDVVLGGEVPLDELHAWLAAQLPRYMVPRYLERREALPKTLSQRVEKYKLVQEGVDRAAVRVFEPVRRRSGAAPAPAPADRSG